MAQKKERTDEISFDSGNAVKYNKIANFQGNPKKVALFFYPDRGLMSFSFPYKCKTKFFSRKRPHNG